MSDEYEHKYKMTYQLEQTEVTKDEIPEGFGACDAMIMHSIIFPPDGSYSHYMVTLDGRTGKELETLEEFKAWSMMARTLLGREDLSPGRRELVQLVWDTVVAAMKGAKDGT